MKSVFTLGIISLSFIGSLSLASTDEHYALITEGSANPTGYCQLSLGDGKAFIHTSVFNASENSSLTIWYTENGSKMGKFGGGFTNANGRFNFSREMTINPDVQELTLIFKDHQRSFQDISDSEDLKIELNQSKSNDAANSNVSLGECAFNIDKPQTTVKNINNDIGFIYDAFSQNSASTYTSKRESESAWHIRLGGINNYTVYDISGAWVYEFSIETEAQVKLSLEYTLNMAPNFESNEVGSVLLQVENVLDTLTIDQLSGNGNGGSLSSTDKTQNTQQLGTLPAGNYRVLVGASLNQKSISDEVLTLDIHNINVIY